MKLINCITLILLVVTYTISQPTGKLDKFVDDVVDAIINKDKKNSVVRMEHVTLHRRLEYVECWEQEELLRIYVIWNSLAVL